MSAGARLSLIIINAAIDITKLTLDLVWEILVAVGGFFYDLATLLYAQKGWTLFIALGLVFGIGTVMRFFQNEAMMSVDVSWECGFIRGEQAMESFFEYFMRRPYEWAAPRWNDILEFWLDCIKAFVSDLKMLGPPDSANSYADFINYLYELVKCWINVIPTISSWGIPFLQEGVTAIYRVVTCYTDFVRDVFFAVTEQYIFNSDTVFCALDPMEHCALRFGPNAPNETCVGSISFEAEICYCMALTWNVFWDPFVPLTGVNITIFMFELSDAFACILAETWRPPFFLVIGLIQGPPCIDFPDVPGFLLNDWLIPWGDCFNDFIVVATMGEVTDFWLLFFSVIFDFIQIFIDAAVLLGECYGSTTFTNCVNAYPDGCTLSSSTTLPTGGGLRQCFQAAGDCVVAGGSPVLPDVIFDTILPEIFFFVDFVTCNMWQLKLCMTGPTPPPPNDEPVTFPDCPCRSGNPCPNGCPLIGGDTSFLQVISCLLFCVDGRVPLMSPLARFLRSGLTSTLGFACTFSQYVQMILDNINDVFNSVCSKISLGGCNIFLTEELNGPKPYSLENWHQVLDDHNVSANTSCGFILRNADPGHIDRKPWADYTLFWFCTGILDLGMEVKENNTDYDINPLLNFGTMVHSILEVPTYVIENRAKKSSRVRRRIGNRPARVTTSEWNDATYNETIERRMAWFGDSINDVGFPMLENFQAFVNKMSGENPFSFHDKASGIHTDFYPGYVFNEIVKTIQDTTYYKMYLGYRREHDAVKEEMFNVHGWYPGMRGYREKPPLSVVGRNSSSARYALSLARETSMQSGDHSDNLDYFYSGEGTYRRALSEQQYIIAMDELFLRFVSAFLHEYKTNGPKRPWYTYRDAGVIGNPDAYSDNPDDHWELTDQEKKQLTIVKARQKYGRNGRAKYAQTSRLMSDEDYTRLIDMDSLRDYHQIKIYTREEMARKRRAVMYGYELVSAQAKVMGSVYSIVGNDEGLLARIYDRYAVNMWPSVQRFYMVMDAIKTNDWSQVHEVTIGNKGYLVDEGFVSKERYLQAMEENPPRKRGSMLDVISGEYSPREERTTGPFLTDQHAKVFPSIKDLHKWYTMNSRREMTRRLREMGHEINTLDDLRVAVDVGDIIDTGTKFALGWFDYVVNSFEPFVHAFTLGSVSYHLDAVSATSNFLKRLISLDFIEDTLDAGEKFLKRYFICQIPANLNGTAIYSPFCFPLMPETVLNFIRAGANSIFPLQVPWPEELISTNCTNTYNGNPNLFSFRLSDNCGSMDGMPRPFCDTCDYCERQYSQCNAVSIADFVDTGFYILGVVPVAINEFFRGGISTSTIYSVGLPLMFLLLMPQMWVVFVPPAWPSLALGFILYAWVVWTLDIVFDRFFPGEGGGIPWGIIYIGILVLMIYLFPAVFAMVPVLTGVLAIIAAVWMINFIWPFPDLLPYININAGLEQVFRFFNEAPTVFKHADWGRLIDSAQRFNYRNGVSFLDTFCFFWELDNISLMIMFWTTVAGSLYLAYLVIIPVLAYIVGLLKLLLEVYRKLRLLRTQVDVEDLKEWRAEIEDKLEETFEYVDHLMFMSRAAASRRALGINAKQEGVEQGEAKKILGLYSDEDDEDSVDSEESSNQEIEYIEFQEPLEEVVIEEKPQVKRRKPRKFTSLNK